MAGVDAGRIAALGEAVRIQGFGLAGVLTLPAEDPEAVRAALRSLPSDIGVLILTSAAAAALGPTRLDHLLTVVMPL